MGKHSQHMREVTELIPLEIVRIRFAVLDGTWIRIGFLYVVHPCRDCQMTILPVYPACTSVERF
jgi:hypothetical protein